MSFWFSDIITGEPSSPSPALREFIELDYWNVKKEVHDKLNFSEQQLMLLTQEMKDKIHNIVEDVEQRVSKALNDDIRRLSVLVDEFNVPFHPDSLVLKGLKG